MSDQSAGTDVEGVRGTTRRRGAAEPAPWTGGLLAMAALLLVTAVASLVEPWLGLGVLSAILLVGLLRLKGRATSLIVVYVFALFLISSRYTLGPFSVSVATLVGAIALMFWLLGRVLPGTDVARGFPTVVLAILGSVGLLLITYAGSQLQPLSATQTTGADRHIVELLGYTGAALLVCDTVRTRRARDRVLFAIVLGGGIIAVIGILQFLFSFDLSSSLRPPGFSAKTEIFIYTRDGLNRVAGTARHPIEFGVVCAVVLPLALHLARHGLSSLVRGVSWVSALALAIVIPMALSRSALVALVVVAVIMLPCWPAERRLKVIVAVGAVIALLTVISPGLLSSTNDLVNGKTGTASAQYRDEANAKAYKLFGQHPWLGEGYGTFDSDTQFILDNTYLTMLVEGGVVGTAALVVLLLVPATVAVGIRRRSRDPATRDLSATLLAMILAVGISGWGLSFLSYPLLSGVLFLTIGLVGCLSRAVPYTPLTRSRVGAAVGRQ